MSSFLGGAMTQKDYLLFQDNIRKEKANLDSRSLKISIDCWIFIRRQFY